MKIEIPYPPTANTYYRRAGRVIHISAKGRAFKQAVIDAVVEQHPVKKKMAGKLAVNLLVNPPDARRRDLDNLIKPTLDALTSAGVWGDDCQVKQLYAEMGEPVRGGLAMVEIKKMGANHD